MCCWHVDHWYSVAGWSLRAKHSASLGSTPTSVFVKLDLLATGTGRSLSLKLLQQLREEGSKLSSGSGDGANAAGGGRTFREIVLQEPIRWATEQVLPHGACKTAVQAAIASVKGACVACIEMC